MSPLVIPIITLLLPIVIVPTVLGIRYARAERELEHAERMRAMELGLTHPRDEAWWTPARICVMIGAGVPVAVSFCTWMASAAVGYHKDMWVMSGMVGISAVICGTTLASKHFTHRARLESRAARGFDAKPMMVDDDAYDVVSSRG